MNQSFDLTMSLGESYIEGKATLKDKNTQSIFKDAKLVWLYQASLKDVITLFFISLLT
jgi:hypothetical protein